MTRAEVFRDALGVPHLRADDELALAEAQGRVTALDRAWQVEVDRWRAEGRLAEHLGPAGAEWDRFARRIRLADTAQRAYAALGDDDRAWVDAYVRGVNAGLVEGRERAPEFETLADPTAFGGAPAPAPTPWPNWAPLGVFLVAHLLFSTFPHLLWRHHVATTLGDEQVEVFAPGAPGAAGSNAWAIHGSRTTTGSPILAGDPHRLLELPGVYQQVRLACPEYDVVGLAFPGVPGLPHFGHAGAAAWGVTNAIAHAVDVFEERLRERDGDMEARGPSGWERTSAHEEELLVRGEPAQMVSVIETARGPIVVDGPGGCFSVRLPARVDADLGFAAFRRLLRAGSAADIASAFERWVDPVNRVVAADRAGSVLRFTAGRLPGRAAGERRLPLPAWSAADAHPGAESSGWPAMSPPEPVTSFAVDANERPDRVDADLGYAYPASTRADRLRHLLTAAGAESGSVDAEAQGRLHADVHDARSLALVARLGAAAAHSASSTSLTPAARALLDDLLAWDGHWGAESVPAARFASWRSALVRRLTSHPAIAPLHTAHGMGAIFDPWFSVAARVGDSLEAVLDIGTLGIDGPAELLLALDDASVAPEASDTAEASVATGASWGASHRLLPLHVLADVRGLAPDAVPGVPTTALAGDTDTVRCTGTVPGVTDLAFRGSVARWVWDLGDRDRSRWNVPFGASGIPGDPHFADQLDDWAHARTTRITTDWAELRREDPA
ncbi:penicillin acylase family protein [Agromyces sp. MMS24-K17]|uniref:penicillin acylase family protein n=1 Tax=Agromyces sp. MMS24-K17 TaxID=3372850 RepID=UPI003754CCA2